MRLTHHERNASQLEVGALRVLFSYDDPVAFVVLDQGYPQTSAPVWLDDELSKASRAHLARWRPSLRTMPLRCLLILRWHLPRITLALPLFLEPLTRLERSQ